MLVRSSFTSVLKEHRQRRLPRLLHLVVRERLELLVRRAFFVVVPDVVHVVEARHCHEGVALASIRPAETGPALDLADVWFAVLGRVGQ